MYFFIIKVIHTYSCYSWYLSIFNSLLFYPSFIYFKKYLLSACYVLGTIKATDEIQMNKRVCYADTDNCKIICCHHGSSRSLCDIKSNKHKVLFIVLGFFPYSIFIHYVIFFPHLCFYLCGYYAHSIISNPDISFRSQLFCHTFTILANLPSLLNTLLVRKSLW